MCADQPSPGELTLARSAAYGASVAGPTWDEHYQQGFLPWDTGAPDPCLVELVRTGVIAPGRALEVGCGTGTNARWLAEQGFEVLGVDVAPTAIEIARERLESGLACRFEVSDFLAAPPEPGPFDFVYDCGCFHVFERAEDQTRFASRVAEVLGPEGRWLSILGSTEGPPRDMGPPRRSARDITHAIEPHLELIELRSVVFDLGPDRRPMGWLSLSRMRSVPAQPSTRWT